MPEIKIKIRDKRAGGTGTIICGNSDYTVVWDLDAEWAAYDTKTMRVNLADGTYQDVVFTGDSVALPVVSTPGWVSVGLYAGDLHTSRAADLRVLPSVTTPGGAPADPPESVYDQLMELIRGMGGASEEDIAKAVASYLTEHPVKEADPTVPAWAKEDSKPTYTAAEVGALSADTLQTATEAALGCRIDGGQAELVRVPYADQGLNKIPDSVTNEQALFVGDILATGFWAAKISEIKSEDTVLIIGAGPTGICTLLCAALKEPKRIIVCEKDPARLTFVREHYPKVLTCTPGECEGFVLLNSDHGGADVVLEVAGGKDTFRLAWRCARPNAIVTVVALYDEAQTLPLPEMYGKNLTFKTGGVDGCDCAEILRLIEQGKLDTTPLITHRFPLSEIEEAYRIFENRLDGVIKVAITADKPQKFGRQ